MLKLFPLILKWKPFRSRETVDFFWKMMKFFIALILGNWRANLLAKAWKKFFDKEFGTKKWYVQISNHSFRYFNLPKKILIINDFIMQYVHFPVCLCCLGKEKKYFWKCVKKNKANCSSVYWIVELRTTLLLAPFSKLFQATVWPDKRTSLDFPRS